MSIRLLLLMITTVSILCLRFYLFFNNQIVYKDGQIVSFSKRLIKEPTTTGIYQKISLQNGFQKINIFLPRFPEFMYGDEVKINGKIQLRNTNNLSIQKSGVRTHESTDLVMYFPKIERTENNKNPFLSLVSSFRQKMIEFFEKTLPKSSSDLLLGIVFGIKRQFDPVFYNDLKISGVMHVVAASGMNVTMLSGALYSILILFLRRQTVLVVSILILVFYAALSSFEASILRATLMISMVFLAQIFGRQSHIVYVLALTFFTMLLFSPILLFDTGFQLSFLSTIGLLYLTPFFRKSEGVKTFLEKSFVGEDIITTISAQIATAPILLSTFGQYSYASILVNGLVLWTIPFLMILGGIGGIISIIIPPLGSLFLYLSLPLLIYFETVIHIFSAATPMISVSSFPWQLAVGYYLLLISCILYFRNTQKTQYTEKPEDRKIKE